MDVRSIQDKAPALEHEGTVAVGWLVEPREMKAVTEGGFLDLGRELEGAGGGGMWVSESEERLILPGARVHTPPTAVHSLKPISEHAGIHCFCFAVAVK